MKRTWIKVKRGILEPKHRRALGLAIYLYLYMIDIVNWEDGKIHEWTDISASEELDMPIKTIREYRKLIEKEKYISCVQHQHSQEITIKKWTNPREYSGDTMNQGALQTEPSSSDKIEGSLQGSLEGSLEEGFGQAQIPLSSSSHTSHIIIKDSDEKQSPSKHPAIQAVREVTKKYPPKDVMDVLIRVIGENPDVEKLRSCYETWRLRSYNPLNFEWVTSWYVSGIPSAGPRGYAKPKSDIDQRVSTLLDKMVAEVVDQQPPERDTEVVISVGDQVIDTSFEEVF